VQAGLRKAAHALEDAGYAVDELEPPEIDAAANAVLVMDSAPGVRAVWEQVLAASAPPELRRFVSAFFEAAAWPDAAATEQAFMTRHALAQAWGAFQELHPLIVAPIASDIPREAGTDLDAGQVAEDIRTMRMAMAVNALGLPAVALPVGVGEGLPQAVQVIGPRYREDLCLDAVQMIEERLGVLTPIDPR
jgi:amidase